VDTQMRSIELPWLFIVNSVVLAISSVFIQLCRKYFDKKHEVNVLRFGWLAFAATLLFLVLQIVAWNQLVSQQIVPGSTRGHGYLYAISILHFLHVLAGLPFLLRILMPMTLAKQEGNASLLFIQDTWRRKLTHTTWYWHFIDLIWIYLVIFFFVNGKI
jgi:cytochrome c oxidase subunit 3